ncbi:MAG: hypothetical protein GWP14_02930, partial [Actinobacteria bacterium]|nr:hypothetical protein [Actinomycetota bacterium]
MGITFTKRHGRRYRYYLCNHAAKNGYQTCPVKSVAAGEIEAAVFEQLRRVFRSPDVIARTFRAAKDQLAQEHQALVREQKVLNKRLAQLKKMIRNLVRADSDNGDGVLTEELQKLNGEFSETENRLRTVELEIQTQQQQLPSEKEVAEALRNIDPVWDELFPFEQERVVKLLVQQVIVSDDGLLLRLRTNGLRSLVAEVQTGSRTPASEASDACTHSLDIHIPMEFKKRSGRKEIILPEGSDRDESQSPGPLAFALAQAFKWQEMLDTGQVDSLDELARQLNVDRSYIGRILKLTALAPDIVEAILNGSEPSSLSLARLRNDFPLRWDDQHRILMLPGL